MREFLGREELYPEETYHTNKLSQRVCLNIQYDAVHNELHEIERENGMITSTSLIGKDIKYKRTASMLFYVREELLAIELVNRWINEEKLKGKDYTLLGVDRTYSVFD